MQTGGARGDAIGRAVELSAAANTILVSGDGSEFGEWVSCPRNHTGHSGAKCRNAILLQERQLFQ
jgi:hypothetical protein